MKDFLKKLIARKKIELKATELRFDKSTDEAEVRALGETLAALKQELEDAEKQLAELEKEGEGTDDDGAADNTDDEGAADSTRSNEPATRSNVTARNGQIVASYYQGTAQKDENKDPYDSVAYRTAFMEHVCRNKPIPAEYREATMAADAGAVIPTTMLKEIIQKIESYGNVYALVRKLNIQGGVTVPISDLKPSASWVGEESGTDQKLSAENSVSFSYYGVECKIAQSLLVSVTTLDAFQALFVPLATEAIVKALEIAIFVGDGVNKPLGITKDTRVPAVNVITMSEEEFNDWAAWHEKVKGKMKKAYRKGVFFMNQSTFDGKIDGMTDKNGQPVGRTNYGINGEETYRFMGKDVETVEDECIAAWDDAAEGDVVAVFVNPTDYAVNSNMQMTVTKWIDNDTNKVKNKAMMICDGKLLDANGVLIIKKGAVSA